MNVPAMSLCIVNFNGADHLPHAFAALEEQAWPFAEVLLVDNASTDGSLALVQTLRPQTRVIRLAQNLGPGGARNAGLAAARSDLILFQDNDVRLERDTAGLLLEELQAHAGTLLVAPRVLYANDETRVQFDSADCHFLGLMATRNADAPVARSDDAPADTTSLVTACFLIDRDRWEGGEPFDESLGFNLEDHDFGVRACITGHRLRVQPRARVLHGGGTPGLSYRPGQLPAAERQFYLTRNRWIVIAKCFSTRSLLLLSPAFLFFELMQFCWLASQGRSRVWIHALGSFWASRETIRGQRRAIQRTRSVPDRCILRAAPLPLTRHVRHSAVVRRIVPPLDRLLRGYWCLVRRWIG